MSLFISQAHAAGEASADGNPMSMIFMLVVFGAVFYFMIYRPQARRAKAHKNLMENISKNDEVLTTGGLIGRVVKLSDNGYVQIELNENNTIMIKKDFVTAVLPNGTLKSI